MKPDEIKERLDIHDVADRLNLQRPGRSGNYRSPHRKDASPSLALWTAAEAKGGKALFKDWATGQSGSVIDLVQYVLDCDFTTAMEWLHDEFQLPKDKLPPQQQGKKSLAEWIAERTIDAARDAAGRDAVKAYLTGRGITEEVVDRGLKLRALGWNTYTSTKHEVGQPGHGGPGVSFIVRSPNPGHVVAVDTRYADPALNGGVKTNSQGEKLGAPWCMSWRSLAQARDVVAVESAINALSVESAGLPRTAGLALRGTQTIEELDLNLLVGKRVLICMDADEINDYGRQPGPEAGWALYDRLTAAGICAHLVNQDKWELNDVNDILQNKGRDTLREALKNLDQWLIPGLPGNNDLPRKIKRRVFLPAHDWAQYWRFRTREDFTVMINEIEDKETGEVQTQTHDLAGFRVASLSRVSVASALSTITGEADSAPQVLFSVTVQAPRHGAQLQRRVLDDDQLHNPAQWTKFGPIFKPQGFARMLTILERAADLGSRKAINFVGLAWRDGKPIVNEGPDCYFKNPDQQCPYSGLRFPSGPVQDTPGIIEAYQATMRDNAAAMLLVWALGAHLKAFLGFWPHMIMQSGKGAGKTTLAHRLSRTLSMHMFSGQSINTEFRQLTSLSYTSHPVGWEELSARQQQVIDKAVSILQEAYQFQYTRRGSEMTEYLISAPVLLAGEDVPVDSLLGKVVRTDLTGKKGTPLPQNLPRWPLRQWLDWLAALSRDQVLEQLASAQEFCQRHSCAAQDDDGARRITGNYAALLTSWKLVCEFAGIDVQQGGFINCAIREMNDHIRETRADREPWVKLTEILLSEIDAGQFRHPYLFDEVVDEAWEGHQALLVRTSHVIAHISTATHLRDRFSASPVKSDRVYKRMLRQAGVTLDDKGQGFERTINGRRVSHMTALSLDALAQYGLHVTTPEREGALV